jgi:arsenate reductase
MSKRRVLFLCTGNSARSQMAEGFANHFLGDAWEAHSAGTVPAATVHPLAVQAMAELDIDIRRQQPKSVDVFRGQDFDQVITLCDSAAAQCPFWLGRGRQVHIGFPDPAAIRGTEAERLAAFRQVRDAIRAEILGYLGQIDTKPAEEPLLKL